MSVLNEPFNYPQERVREVLLNIARNNIITLRFEARPNERGKNV